MWTHGGAPLENPLSSCSRGSTSNATANIVFLLAPSPDPNRVMIHTYGTYEEMDHRVYYRSRFDSELHCVGFLLDLNSKNLFWVLTER